MCAQAAFDPAHVALAASAGCEAADMASTMYFVGKGTVREANDYLARYQDFPLQFTAVKWGTATAGMGFLWWVHTKYPTVATVLLTANAVGKCWIATRNDRLGRGVR